MFMGFMFHTKIKCNAIMSVFYKWTSLHMSDKRNGFIIQHPVAFCYHKLFIKQTLMSSVKQEL